MTAQVVAELQFFRTKSDIDFGYGQVRVHKQTIVLMCIGIIENQQYCTVFHSSYGIGSQLLQSILQRSSASKSERQGCYSVISLSREHATKFLKVRLTKLS